MMRAFSFPLAVSVVLAAIVFFFGGVAAFLTVVFLSVLEVALSFDNAVVNAQVLKKMEPRWQKRFLRWGILIAVVGTRLVLPILLVSAAALMSPVSVALLAFSDGDAYAFLIGNARFAIGAFGGAFLTMLALRYFLNPGKTVHWIPRVEPRLARLGEIQFLEVFITLAILLAAALCAAPAARLAIIVAGLVGIGLSIGIEEGMKAISGRTGGILAHGFAFFLYLEVLDSAFSLDGVVGAFALTTSIPLIVIGLGIGAYFVRTLTLYLTEHRILESLVYIEHGAYWAIFGLAISMFAGLAMSVPEFITGTVGGLFMIAAYISSVRVRHAA